MLEDHREHNHNHNHNSVEAEEEYSLGMKALMKSLHISFVALALIIVGMLVWYFTGEGIFTVEPNEKAIVKRFGKIVRICDDGWYWDFPYPFSTVIKIPTSEQNIKIKAFAVEESELGFEDDGPKMGPLVPGKDGYLLTGDRNILRIEWELRYSISDVEKYYLSFLCPADPRKPDKNIGGRGTRGPRTILSNLLQNSIIKVTARERIEDALYKNSARYQADVEKEFSEAVGKLDMGIEVENVPFKNSTVPGKAIKAFQDVNLANQESNELKNKARKYAFEQISNAKSREATIIQEAKSYRTRVVEEVEAEKVAFLKFLKEYNQNPDTALLSLYNSTLVKVINSAKDRYIVTMSENGKQEIRLKINPEPVIKKKSSEKGK